MQDFQILVQNAPTQSINILIDFDEQNCQFSKSYIFKIWIWIRCVELAFLRANGITRRLKLWRLVWSKNYFPSLEKKHALCRWIIADWALNFAYFWLFLLGHKDSSKILIDGLWSQRSFPSVKKKQRRGGSQCWGEFSPLSAPTEGRKCGWWKWVSVIKETRGLTITKREKQRELLKSDNSESRIMFMKVKIRFKTLYAFQVMNETELILHFLKILCIRSLYFLQIKKKHLTKYGFE